MLTTIIRTLPISNGVPVTLALASPNRVRIEFHTVFNTAMKVSIGVTPQTSHNQGIALWASNERYDVLSFNYRDHGDIVKSAWYGFPQWPGGNPPFIGVVETFRQ